MDVDTYIYIYMWCLAVCGVMLLITFIHICSVKFLIVTDNNVISCGACGACDACGTVSGSSIGSFREMDTAEEVLLLILLIHFSNTIIDSSIY